MPSRCEPASLVKSPITAGGGGVGGLGGERKGGGGGELGERERGGCCGGRGCTVVNGVGQLGFDGLPWCGSGHCCGSEEIRILMEQELLGWLMWR